MNYPQQPGQPHGYQQPYPPQQPHGWAAPPPAAPPKKKRRIWLWVVLAVVLLLVIAAIAGGGGSSPSNAPAGAGGTATDSGTSSDAVTVKYEIVGSGRAGNITYNTDGGSSISQDANVKLPWTKQIQIERSFAIATITAQNSGSGQITCRISVDGQVVKEATSSGQYAVVSCTSDPIT